MLLYINEWEFNVSYKKYLVLFLIKNVFLSAFFKDRFTTFTLSFTARIKPKSVTAFDLPTFFQTDLIQSTSDPG